MFYINVFTFIINISLQVGKILYFCMEVLYHNYSNYCMELVEVYQYRNHYSCHYFFSAENLVCFLRLLHIFKHTSDFFRKQGQI